jgi:hypothetical protein
MLSILERNIVKLTNQSCFYTANRFYSSASSIKKNTVPSHLLEAFKTSEKVEKPKPTIDTSKQITRNPKLNDALKQRVTALTDPNNVKTLKSVDMRISKVHNKLRNMTNNKLITKYLDDLRKDTDAIKKYIRVILRITRKLQKS